MKTRSTTLTESNLQKTAAAGHPRALVLAVDRFAFWLSAHWLATFIAIYGAWVLAPFLAPIFMAMGAPDAANGVYTTYSFFCHQLPERSIFLFGSKPMYSLTEIKQVWDQDGFLGLRLFNGTPEFGYKVAWSDRMISFYGSVWVGALLFALLRNRVRQLSVKAWIIAGILPVGLDGATHMINDLLAGTSGEGFRDTNAWLQFLTGNALPGWFYAGDAFGSFNSDVRWITGFLFGLTTVWFLFPMIDHAMREVKEQIMRTVFAKEA